WDISTDCHSGLPQDGFRGQATAGKRLSPPGALERTVAHPLPMVACSSGSPCHGQATDPSLSVPLLALVRQGVLLTGTLTSPWGCLSITLGMPIQPLERPIQVLTLDGQPAGAGPVTYCTQPLTLRVGPHVETVVLYLTCIPQLHLVLGSPWLKQHNPHIDWVTQSIVTWGPHRWVPTNQRFPRSTMTSE
ncbi:hypothetical protein NFI96_005371, partial [Prochilodus magdalenae]